jgi:hypothetical protein
VAAAVASLYRGDAGGGGMTPGPCHRGARHQGSWHHGARRQESGPTWQVSRPLAAPLPPRPTVADVYFSNFLIRLFIFRKSKKKIYIKFSPPFFNERTYIDLSALHRSVYKSDPKEKENHIEVQNSCSSFSKPSAIRLHYVKNWLW